MSLVISKVFTYDTDAGNYIQAVEAADTVALEPAVRQAINNFVVGCKQDGIWSAIKASCILAGARTTNGALIPLKGTAPTPVNFDLVNNTDYNRKTGLIGNGSTKYLDSNYSQSSQPQDSRHIATFIGQGALSLGAANALIFAQSASNVRSALYFTANSTLGYSCSSGGSTADIFSSSFNGLGFYGHSRSTGASYVARVLGVQNTINTASIAPESANYGIFGRLPAAGTLIGFSGRLAFYSIGESLDLQKLDSRVTDLMAAFNNPLVIP